MKNTEKGFVKGLFITILVLVLLGVLVMVFFYWQTNQALDQARTVPSQSNSTASSSNSNEAALNLYESIEKYVNIVRTIAETSYKENYSAGLTPSNTSTVNGAGINTSYQYPVASMTYSQVLSTIAAKGGKIFAITNSGPTAYAVYGLNPNDQTQYYCIDSTGSKALLNNVTVFKITCN